MSTKCLLARVMATVEYIDENDIPVAIILHTIHTSLLFQKPDFALETFNRKRGREDKSHLVVTAHQADNDSVLFSPLHAIDCPNLKLKTIHWSKQGSEKSDLCLVPNSQ